MALKNSNSFHKVLILVLGVAFGFVLLAMGYQGVKTAQDLRSRAASTTSVYKQWTFASSAEGWSGISKNVVSAVGGHLQLSISTSRNVPAITNSTVNTSIPAGKKYVALTIALDSSTRKPRDQQKTFQAPVPVKGNSTVRQDLVIVPVALSQDTDTSFASKSGYGICTQEVMMCPDGSYVGRTGISCAFAPCPVTTPTAHGKPVTILVYYKLTNTDWSKVPLTYNANLVSSYQQFMIPFPESLPEGGPITVTGLRFTFPGGLAQYDVVRIDDISLLGPILLPPTPTPKNPCQSAYVFKVVGYSGTCGAQYSEQVNYTCSDGYTGILGDGKTCQATDYFNSQARSICAARTTCNVGQTTPRPTGMPVPTNYTTPPPYPVYATPTPNCYTQCSAVTNVCSTVCQGPGIPTKYTGTPTSGSNYATYGTPPTPTPSNPIYYPAQ